MGKDSATTSSCRAANKSWSLDNDWQEKVFDQLEAISVRYHVQEKNKNIDEVFI